MMLIAKLYSWVYGMCKDFFHFNLRGIGFISSLIHHDAVLTVQGNAFYFNHKLSTSYVRLLSGNYNEPETHAFVNFLADHITGKLFIIDVGANIGEMVIDFSRHPHVNKVVAFEPLPECCFTIRKSLQLNGRTDVVLVEKAVSDKPGTTLFHIDKNTAVSSSLMGAGGESVIPVATTTIDEEIPFEKTSAIMIIDVEGAEMLVLRGAKKFITLACPVIVFEYNELGRKYYTLDDVKEVLGEGYMIFRLRQDGYLDNDLIQTWNCVAVKKNSWAYEICMTRRR